MSASALAHDTSRIVSLSADRPAEPHERQPMTLTDQERWLRVQARLRAAVGEEIFKSWFAAMGQDAIENDTVRLSVPTRFLKSWVQSHYADKLLACWKAELPSIRRIDLVHRSAVLRNATVKPKANEPVETPKRLALTVPSHVLTHNTPVPLSRKVLPVIVLAGVVDSGLDRYEKATTAVSQPVKTLSSTRPFSLSAVVTGSHISGSCVASFRHMPRASNRSVVSAALGKSLTN